MKTMKQQKTRSVRPVCSATTSLAFFLALIGLQCSAIVHAQTPKSPFGEPGAGMPGEARSGGADTQSGAVATLAGGCFWCTEAVFEGMKGVNEVVSGYIGGTVPNPTYEQVCEKRTGHAEAVEVYYDPTIVSFEEILEVFFKTHDPTTANRQGNDFGPQYRSVVFFHDAEQEMATKKYIAKLEAEREFRGKIVTEVVKADRFWEAEEYHQDYYKKNPTAGYCRAVVSKKVKKFNDLFEDKKKER